MVFLFGALKPPKVGIACFFPSKDEKLLLHFLTPEFKSPRMPIHRRWVIQQKNIAELQPQECPHSKNVTMDEQVKEHRGVFADSLGDDPQPVGEQTGEKSNQVNQGAG